MAQSFGVVEDKLHEADFFLDRLAEVRPHSRESRYYFSAFVAAARTVTLSMQTSLSDTNGFQQWYECAQRELKTNALARQFLEIRNTGAHEGRNPLNRIDFANLAASLKKQLAGDHSHELLLPACGPNKGSILVDAVEASTSYFKLLVRIVFDCYEQFKCAVDPQWYFTESSFSSQGKRFADALAEFGYPQQWADFMPSVEDGWRILRSSQPSCGINDLFEKYLGKVITGPDHNATNGSAPQAAPK